MTLASSADIGKPLILGRFQCDARSDRFHRSLEALKIPFGPEPDDTPTIRTPIKLEQQRFVVSIKNSFGKTMAPQPLAVAAWAVVWFLPRIITLLFEKVLEFDNKKYYHFIVPCGSANPLCCARAVGLYFNPPPLLFKIKKASFLRPVYSGKPFLFVNRF